MPNKASSDLNTTLDNYRIEQKTGTTSMTTLHPETGADVVVYDNSSSGLSGETSQDIFDNALPIVGEGAVQISEVNNQVVISVDGAALNDTKVQQNAITSGEKSLLLANATTSGQSTDASYSAAVKLNVATNTISANISGAAASATNVNLSVTGSGSDTIRIQAGSGTAAQFTVNGVAEAQHSGFTTYIQKGSDTTKRYDYDDIADIEKHATSAMVFKGTLGTGGTITTLPAADAQYEGDMYKVITAGTYQGLVCKVGDSVVCYETSTVGQYAWIIIPSGDEPSGTVTNIATGAGLTGGPITTSGTISHADTSSQTSVTNTGTTFIQSVALDDFGHVTSMSSGTYTESSYTLGSDGTINGTAKIVLKKNAIEVSSQIIDGDKDIEVVYNSSNTRLRVQHSNNTTAKTAYTATGTGTVSANGGQIKITDFKYDSYGHVTDSETNTITLSQVLNTAGSTNLGATKLYLVGASTQAANPQTYSNSLIYVGVDNNLYAQSTTAGSSARVITAGDIGSVTSAMLANSGVTAGTYCAVTVNNKGLVTAGGHVVEIGTVVDADPDNLLVNGGLFFRLIEE